MSVKQEQVTVPGVVLFCDACGRRGPQEACLTYTPMNITLATTSARLSPEGEGWSQGKGGTEDYCPTCHKDSWTKATIALHAGLAGRKR